MNFLLSLNKPLNFFFEISIIRYVMENQCNVARYNRDKVISEKMVILSKKERYYEASVLCVKL